MDARTRTRRRGARWSPALATAAALLTAGLAHAREPALVSVSAGPLGAQLERGIASDRVYGVEYRGRPRGSLGLRPAVGYDAAESGASIVYGGVARDIFVTPRWTVTPVAGVGSFDAVEELDLGLHLEFRVGLESAVHLRRGHRLGLALIHLSNGGLSEHNPGVEAVVVSFGLAWDR